MGCDPFLDRGWALVARAPVIVTMGSRLAQRFSGEP
jgi:uracil-DNA glycosylase